MRKLGPRVAQASLKEAAETRATSNGKKADPSRVAVQYSARIVLDLHCLIWCRRLQLWYRIERIEVVCMQDVGAGRR